MGISKQNLVEVGVFANYSQPIGPKGLKYTRFNEGHPWVVIREFGVDQSKTMPVGLFFPKNYLVVVIVLYLSEHPTYYNCVNTYISKTPSKPLPVLFYLFLF